MGTLALNTSANDGYVAALCCRGCGEAAVGFAAKAIFRAAKAQASVEKGMLSRTPGVRH
jgi:hypothetical protein